MPAAPLVLAPREEWPDADFDFPEEEPIRASDLESDKGDLDDLEDDDDWDVDTDSVAALHGGHTIKGPLVLPSRPAPPTTGSSGMITIRPPIPVSDTESEGEVSTIKGLDTLRAAMPSTTPTPAQDDDDLEADFALPSDMTQLSLRPASLRPKSSHSSFEWGDKDQTASSSQSSDAFTSLGFAGSAGSSPTSHHTSASLPETETEEEDEDELDGLVIPSGLFESGAGSKHLAKLLEMKKKLPSIDERVKIASPDPEDDFEDGLVIDDDAEFGRLQLANNVARRAKFERSRSAPATRIGSSAFRPASGGSMRNSIVRTKSPNNPPPSSLRHFRQMASSAAPPPPPQAASLRHYPSRATTMQMPGSAQAAFLTPKTTSLRGQKSHGNFNKPPSPQNRLSRKASLSAIIDQPHASGSGPPGPPHPVARYEAPTKASRLKSQRGGPPGTPILDVGPPLPSPTAGSSGSRLTMPTSSSRLKARPSAASLFTSGAATAAAAVAATKTPPPRRATSPLPPRPASTTSSKSRTSSVVSPAPAPAVAAPKVMRKPKKARAYGDGTELDAFDDLPTDRDKESRFRVVAKPGHGRVPSGSGFPMSKSPPPKTRGIERPDNNLGPSLRRASKIEFPSKPPAGEVSSRKKKADTSAASKHPQQKRKPTLIRNLGGTAAAKVVGEMKWNPHTLRWEGNDSVLREFESAGAPARPALITQLTGSSLGSPVHALAAGARQVGNMIFDPAQMCWISSLPPDEDEPDVFADLADDENDDAGSSSHSGSWAAAGTIRLAASAPLPSAPSPAPSSSAHSRARSSESGSEHGGTGMFERGSRASLVVADVDEPFREACRAAEARHHVEMTGWRAPRRLNAFGEPDRTFLYEIRALATRQY